VCGLNEQNKSRRKWGRNLIVTLPGRVKGGHNPRSACAHLPWKVREPGHVGLGMLSCFLARIHALMHLTYGAYTHNCQVTWPEVARLAHSSHILKPTQLGLAGI
jgi:hypothetical protein